MAGNLALYNDTVLWNASQLYKDAHSYDYKSVRRWTTPKKLGYSLLECEKVLMCNVYGLELKWKCNIDIYIAWITDSIISQIFVPIHQDIHWCLAVINVHEKKIQYLDSLGGHDENVLHVLVSRRTLQKLFYSSIL